LGGILWVLSQTHKWWVSMFGFDSQRLTNFNEEEIET
jgi:hypothetical protein